MTARNPYDLIRDDVRVGTLPLVFMRLNEVINNPCSSVLDMGTVIEEDQGLTARLLRLANSPFYSFPSKVETIRQAVTVIGTQQMMDLVLATSVMDMFRGIPAELVTMEAFWHHSISCGIIARIMAVYRREPNVERFFVAGILHDIGRLVIYSKMPEASVKIIMRCREDGELQNKAEREVLNFDHADVGEALLKEWKLPLSLREMVAFHHSPSRAMHFPLEAAVAHTSDIIARALQLGKSGDAFVPPMDAGAWSRLELQPGVLSPTIEQAERQFAAAVNLIKPESKQ